MISTETCRVGNTMQAESYGVNHALSRGTGRGTLITQMVLTADVMMSVVNNMPLRQKPRNFIYPRDGRRESSG